MQHDDRRAYERHVLWAHVMVTHGTVHHVLDVLNLSRGGALIDLGSVQRPRWLEVGRAIQVNVLGVDGSTALAAPGKVVRVMESVDMRTFAVQFNELVDETTIRTILRDAQRPPPLPEPQVPEPKR